LLASSLPPEQRAMFEAMAVAAPAEHAEALVSLQASLNGALRSAGLTLHDLGLAEEAAATPSRPLDSGAAQEVLRAAPEDDPRTSSPSPVPAAEQPGPTAIDPRNALPARIASGLRAGPTAAHGASSRGGVWLQPNGAIQMQIPMEMIASLGTLPPGGGDASKLQGEAARMGRTLQQQLQNEMRVGAERYREETEARLESVCASMVEKLQPDAAASGGGASGDLKLRTREATREVTAEARRAAKREAASFGAGLQKGFFAAPKKRRAAKAKVAKAATKVGDKATEVAVSNKENAGAAESAACTARKRKGDRCAECDIKLPITACLQSRCRCGKLYCASHMHCHACEFDYKAATKTKLQRDMPLVVPTTMPSSVA